MLNQLLFSAFYGYSVCLAERVSNQRPLYFRLFASLRDGTWSFFAGTSGLILTAFTARFGIASLFRNVWTTMLMGMSPSSFGA